MTRYVITLEATTDALGREPAQRLKALLKIAGRGLALRCVDLAERPAQQPQTQEEHTNAHGPR